jgi:hypothetical protein
MPISWHATPHSTIRYVVHISPQMAPFYEEVKYVKFDRFSLYKKFTNRMLRQKILLIDKTDICT